MLYFAYRALVDVADIHFLHVVKRVLVKSIRETLRLLELRSHSAARGVCTTMDASLLGARYQGSLGLLCKRRLVVPHRHGMQSV